MSDGGTGEKTEEATPERLRKLRKDGNIPKSQDVTTAVSLLVVFSVLAVALPGMGDNAMAFFHDSLRAIQSMDQSKELIAYSLLIDAIIVLMKMTAPAMAAAFVMGISLNLAQVGFLFTLKPIMPDIKKINPIQGAKNLINKKKLVELLKTILKFVVVGYLSYLALKGAIRDVVLIIRSDLMTAISIIGSIIWDFITKIGGAFLVIAAFDAFYQKKKFMKDNMMSKYDVKQEYKQSEGDPQQKADRKRLHQEMVNSPGSAAVKKADVVVKNPEHIAVALKYDQEEDGGAPHIVAKGSRIWADKILEAAKHYGVPVVRNVPLAQALNKLDVGDDVPEELYDAVAEVLNFVYTLVEEQKKKGR